MSITKFKFLPTIAAGGCITASLGFGYFVIKKTQKNKEINDTISAISSNNVAPDFTAYEISSWKLDEYIQNASKIANNIIKINENNITIPAGSSFNKIGEINTSTLDNLNKEPEKEISIDDLIEEQGATEDEEAEVPTQEAEVSEEDSTQSNDNDDKLDSQQSGTTDEQVDSEEGKNTQKEENPTEISAKTSQSNTTNEKNIQTSDDEVKDVGQTSTTQNQDPYDAIKEALVSRFANDNDAETTSALSIIKDPNTIALMKKLLEEAKSSVRKTITK